jgi:hypothetical protein
MENATVFADIFRYDQFVGPLKGGDPTEGEVDASFTHLYIPYNAPQEGNYYVGHVFAKDGGVVTESIAVGTELEWHGLGPKDLALADFDEDGQLDFVLTLGRPATPVRKEVYSDSLYVFLNKGEGKYARFRLEAPNVPEKPLKLPEGLIIEGDDQQSYAQLSTVAVSPYDRPTIIAGDHTVRLGETGRLAYNYIYRNRGDGTFDSVKVDRIAVNVDTASERPGPCLTKIDRFGNIANLMGEYCFAPPEKPAVVADAGAQGSCQPGETEIIENIPGIPVPVPICCKDTDGDGVKEPITVGESKFQDIKPVNPEEIVAVKQIEDACKK